MQTAVIYARYSSDSQSEQSIEGQLRVCEQYAQTHELVIAKTYIDRAMTGTNDNRPDFQKMIEESKKGDFSVVLVYKLDRFSRNKFENAKYKKILKDNGVKIVSAMENIPDTPEGIILESLLEGMAEYYSAELAQKVKRGMRETRIKGNFQGGTLPYGYKLDGRKIVVDEEKRAVVEYIFDSYANGKYVREIIEELTKRSIFNTKGKPFLQNGIYGILKKELYTGRYTKDGEVFENMFPRIVSDDVFLKVQARQRANHYGKRSVKAVYLFKNKLVCGYCGKPISAESGTSRMGKKINYYKCVGRKKYRNNCEKETIRQDVLEEFLLNAIVSELEKPKNMNAIVKRLLEMQENKTENTNLKLLTKSKKQAETQLENLLHAVEQGVVNKTTNKRMKELENQIDELEKQLLVERSTANLKVTEEEIRKFYSQALKQEPLILINQLIKRIVLYNDKVEITFNTPTPKSPDTQGFSFCQTSAKLKHVIQNKPQPIYTDIQIFYFI